MRGGKSSIEVSQRGLEHNLQAIRRTAQAGRSRAGEEPGVLAVIKADAYGHGATICGPVLARAGAEWLGVTDAAEGAAVRGALGDAGIRPEEQPRMLVMCGFEPGDAALLIEHRLTPVVWFAEQLRCLAACARVEEPLPVHVEIDTGMTRQGVPPGALFADLLGALGKLPQLRLEGVMTHFASAEVAGSALTERQQERFAAALGQMRAAGAGVRFLHAGNTSTLDEARLLPGLAEQAEAIGARLLVRTGLALYGYALPLAGAAAQLSPELERVATWKTHVIAVREVAAGESVGYNGTFTAARPMRVGLLPVGYADGLRRELSATDERRGGEVLIRGAAAPILGRISMNLVSVDVTGIPDAALGDEATLLGAGFDAADHAELAGTIPYEILCGMRGRGVLVA